MERRDVLRRLSAGTAAAAGAGLFTPSRGEVQQAAPPAPAPPPTPRGLPVIRITDVKTILTAPAGIRLVVVKVMTSEPGLYGLGCATFTQRARVVETAVDKYLKPFLIGKDPLQIEDIWQSIFVSSYWRNGPVLDNAHQRRRHGPVGHPRQAGRHAGLPAPRRQVPQGGRHLPPRQRRDVRRRSRRRPGAAWSRATATSACRSACPGLATYGAGRQARGRGRQTRPANRRPQVWEPRPYVRTLPKLFEHLRKQARRRGRAAARHPRARAADPGHAAVQGPGAVQPVLPRRPVQPGGHRLLREPAPADQHADRDGRAVQQPERVDRAADQRTG